jgi:hypothetical protein
MFAAINWSLNLGKKHAEQVQNAITQQVVVVQRATNTLAEQPQTQFIPDMLQTIAAVFAVGEIGFFLLLSFLSIVYIFAVEKDKHMFSAIVTVVGVLLLWNPIVEVFSNWRLALLSVVFYGLLGGLWSVFRFRKLCRKIVAEKPYKSASKHIRDQHTEEEYYQDLCEPSQHKSRLISWIVYWPWSVIWNLAGDCVTGIYDALTNVYSRVARNVVRQAIGYREE